MKDYISGMNDRNNQVTVIKTTPDQEKAEIASFMKTAKKDMGIVEDNCTDRTNKALDAGGIPQGTTTVTTPMAGADTPPVTGEQPLPTNIPGTAGMRAERYNQKTTGSAGTIVLPTGTTTLPSSLDQFNPPSQ